MTEQTAPRGDAFAPSTQALYEENTDIDNGVDSDENIVEDQRDPAAAGNSYSSRELRLGTETSFVAVLKDFFRSTFSDHYPTETYCCGDSELMAVMPGAYCCKGQSDNRIAPESFDASTRNGGTQSSSNCRDVLHSASQSSENLAVPRAPQRKKALAVATGYKYAEDMNGRPVVIVPGTRKAPIDLTTYAAQRQYHHSAMGATRAATAKQDDGYRNSQPVGRTAATAIPN